MILKSFTYDTSRWLESLRIREEHFRYLLICRFLAFGATLLRAWKPELAEQEYLVIAKETETVSASGCGVLIIGARRRRRSALAEVWDSITHGLIQPLLAILPNTWVASPTPSSPIHSPPTSPRLPAPFITHSSV